MTLRVYSSDKLLFKWTYLTEDCLMDAVDDLVNQGYRVWVGSENEENK